MLRVLSFVLLVGGGFGFAGCGQGQGSTACTNRICGDWCNTCVTGSGATCQAVQGICDAQGNCRLGFDPASTDPSACHPCNGQSCAQFQ